MEDVLVEPAVGAADRLDEGVGLGVALVVSAHFTLADRYASKRPVAGRENQVAGLPLRRMCLFFSIPGRPLR